jgi:hypothetical protein
VQHTQIQDAIEPVPANELNFEDAPAVNNELNLLEWLQNAPLFNFQAISSEQGVNYEAGLHPPANNLADSPMQAWIDSIVNSSSDDDMAIGYKDLMQVNSFVITSDSFLDLHAEIWARLSLAKSAIKSCISPSVDLDNCKLIPVEIQLPANVLYEMVGEFLHLSTSRKTTRKNTALDSPSSSFVHIENGSSSTGSVSETSSDYSEDSFELVSPAVGQKRKKTDIHKKLVMEVVHFSGLNLTVRPLGDDDVAPLCTSQARRSALRSEFMATIEYRLDITWEKNQGKTRRIQIKQSQTNL